MSELETIQTTSKPRMGLKLVTKLPWRAAKKASRGEGDGQEQAASHTAVEPIGLPGGDEEEQRDRQVFRRLRRVEQRALGR